MNNKNPATIKIFLPDGDPTGIKEAEVINWTGRSFVIPRKKFKDLNSDSYTVKQLSTPGIYFLIGEEDLKEDRVYVGEAEDLYKRVNHHSRSGKDFWNKAVFFFSKDKNLTKAHVKFLESRIIDIISENNRVELENSNNSSRASLSRAEEAEMENYLKKVELLMPALGYNYLKSLTDVEKSQRYYCTMQTKEVKGMGVLTNEGFVVLKGSLVHKEESNSFENTAAKKLRGELVEEEILKDNEKNYILKEDQLLSSPSAAASFVLGRSANGWTEWKTKDGKTLDEIEREEVEK